MTEIARYRNAGRPKIYDDAMAWILLGFVMYPYDCIRLQLYWLRRGVKPKGTFYAWVWTWQHQMMVWDSL